MSAEQLSMDHANYACALSLMSWESVGDAGKKEMAWSPAFRFVFSVIYTDHQDASEAMGYSHGSEIDDFLTPTQLVFYAKLGCPKSWGYVMK